MATLKEFRAKYPQYNDMSDADLTRALHEKFYSDVPVEDFVQQVGGMSWTDVGKQALQNAPGSAYQFGKAMVQPIIHPIETLQNVGDVAAGGLRLGMRKVLPESVSNYVESTDTDPTAAQRQTDMAGNVGQFYKDRYGSMEGFKQAVASDPIGVLGDAATVLTAGGAALKVGGLSRAGNAVKRAGDLVNPLSPIVGMGKGIGRGAKHVMGMTTGTSADTIGEAYKAGRIGGAYDDAFTRNMRGVEPQEAVLAEAQDAIGNIADARGLQYRQDMRAIKANTTPIDMTPIVKKFNSVTSDAYHGGHQKYSDATMAKIAEVRKVIDEWYSDPSVQNAGGLDALKQRIDDLMPPVTEKNSQASRIITTMRNAVKDEIVKQAPQYATAMKNYESSKAVQTELERSLSLGKKASADTTLRKLQSVTRNNANSNYGSRANNARTLEAAGAKTLMPGLAGQALNTWMPRGLRGPISALAASGMAGLGSGFTPAAIPFLLAGSPRLVGEVANLTGKAARELSRAPRPTRRGLLGLRGLGSVGLIGQGPR